MRLVLYGGGVASNVRVLHDAATCLASEQRELALLLEGHLRLGCTGYEPAFPVVLDVEISGLLHWVWFLCGSGKRMNHAMRTHSISWALRMWG